MDKLTQEVKEFARQVGADMVGIAGKECFSRLPSIQPDELLDDARSVVVIAIRRNTHLPAASGVTYDNQEHYMGSLALDMHVLLRISYFLEDKGFDTRPVSHHGHFIPQRDVIMREAVKELSVTSDGELQGTEEFERVFWERLAVLSHMHLAVEAGLGEIGRCKMLITPKFGPRVGLTSLITNAPLEPDKKLEEPVCKKDECNKCVEICPAGAIQPYGRNLSKCMLHTGGIPPLEMIKNRDEEAIERYYYGSRLMLFPFEKKIFNVIRTGQLKVGGCGKCFEACPVGMKRKKP